MSQVHLNTICFKVYLKFIILVIFLTILAILALLSLVIYLPIFIIASLSPHYGKFLGYMDLWLDEDFVNSMPQCNLVYTMTIEGNLCLDELRSIFLKNVLKARSKVSPQKLQYPELQQFLTTLICFRIWKKDPDFHIENHIVEHNIKSFKGQDPIQKIHEELLNEKFEHRRSPWKVILIRNFIPNGNQHISDKNPKSLVVLKIHHVLADGRSVTKLLIECLAKSALKTANPEIIDKETIWNKIRSFIMYPMNFLREHFKLVRLDNQTWSYPFKIPVHIAIRDKAKVKTVVAFSDKISISDIKQLAIKHGVKTSAVFINIVAGIIKSYCKSELEIVWDKNIPLAYPLPKENHPEHLTNHLYMGALNLPLEEQCAFKRLQQCNQDFVRVKAENQARYTNVGIFLIGSLVYPLCRLAFNISSPIGLTNNAGNKERILIGKYECTDIHMSVGTLKGVIGVGFCALSYKDEIRIGVVGKESVLSKENAVYLAKQINHELQILKNI